MNNIIEKLNSRKGQYIDFQEIDKDKTKLTFLVPTRGLIGFRSELINRGYDGREIKRRQSSG